MATPLPNFLFFCISTPEQEVIYDSPTISNSLATLKNYLGTALITKMRLLQVSIGQTVGKVHDTLVTGAMSQPECMPQFMDYLLGGSFQK
jgi:hypothetical protein